MANETRRRKKKPQIDMALVVLHTLYGMWGLPTIKLANMLSKSDQRKLARVQNGETK